MSAVLSVHDIHSTASIASRTISSSRAMERASLPGNCWKGLGRRAGELRQLRIDHRRIALRRAFRCTIASRTSQTLASQKAPLRSGRHRTLQRENAQRLLGRGVRLDPSRVWLAALRSSRTTCARRFDHLAQVRRPSRRPVVGRCSLPAGAEGGGSALVRGTARCHSLSSSRAKATVDRRDTAPGGRRSIRSLARVVVGPAAPPTPRFEGARLRGAATTMSYVATKQALSVGEQLIEGPARETPARPITLATVVSRVSVRRQSTGHHGAVEARALVAGDLLAGHAMRDPRLGACGTKVRPPFAFRPSPRFEKIGKNKRRCKSFLSAVFGPFGKHLYPDCVSDRRHIVRTAPDKRKCTDLPIWLLEQG